MRRRTSGGHAIRDAQIIPDMEGTREAHGKPEVVQVRGRDLRRFDLDDERAEAEHD